MRPLTLDHPATLGMLSLGVNPRTLGDVLSQGIDDYTGFAISYNTLTFTYSASDGTTWRQGDGSGAVNISDALKRKYPTAIAPLSASDFSLRMENGVYYPSAFLTEAAVNRIASLAPIPLQIVWTEGISGGSGSYTYSVPRQPWFVVSGVRVDPRSVASYYERYPKFRADVLCREYLLSFASNPQAAADAPAPTINVGPPASTQQPVAVTTQTPTSTSGTTASIPTQTYTDTHTSTTSSANTSSSGSNTGSSSTNQPAAATPPTSIDNLPTINTPGSTAGSPAPAPPPSGFDWSQITSKLKLVPTWGWVVIAALVYLLMDRRHSQ